MTTARARATGARSRVVVAGACVAVAVVAWQAWAGQPVGLDAVVVATVSGVAIGSVLAVAASGLVLTYTASGILNLAHGAVGMFLAFVYWELRVNRDLPTPLALLLVLGLVAPLLGIVIERLVVRRLRHAPLVAQIAATVGLMLALMGIAGATWRPATVSRSLPAFFGSAGFAAPGGIVVTWHRLIAVAVALVAAAALWVLLYRTRLGVLMRAVVDDPELAASNGVRPWLVSAAAWAIGAVTAGVAGILLAPEVTFAVEPLTLLVVDAFAAAVIGRLRSLPLTWLGGLVLGLLNAYALTFLDLGGRWSNVRPAIPMILLFVAVLALPPVVLRLGEHVARAPLPRPPSWPRSLIGAVVLVLLAAALAASVSPVTVNRLTLALTTAMVMLSLVPLTGWAGEVSLAPMTFAGIGAFAMVAVAGDSGSVLGILAAVAAALLGGLAMAVPALWLRGVYLALASLAFARIAEVAFFPQPGVFGPSDTGARTVAPLDVLGWQLTSPRGYLVAVAVVFAVVGLGLVALRRSWYGRRLLALHDTPAGLASVGLDPAMTRLSVYALSAALAGLGGALLAVYKVAVVPGDFGMLHGLVIVLLLVIGGVATVSGALLGGLFSVLLVMAQDAWDLPLLSTLAVVGPGLAAIAISQTPQGAAAGIGEALDRLMPWRRDPTGDEPDPAELGRTRQFTPEDLAAVDDVLALPEEYRSGTARA